ncbi:isochorismate synthase [Ectobacillus funiculus]|uniref:isochorismate synthase n=1 Tax=Ectobacillus funiculus TaxID=137993 RepID=UPI00397E2E83
MLRTEHKGLHQSLLTAVQQAAIDTKVLVSAVKKVEWTDPLLFYAAAKQFGYTERFYWSDPEQHIVFAGIGSAFTIANSSQKRFQDTQNRWQQLLNRVIVHGPAYSFGTGPLLFGGFSFDPLKQKTQLWETFSDTVLVLPSFLLTMKEGESWLTINQLVGHDDCAEDLYERMQNMEEQLLQHSRQPLSEQGSVIVSQHEVQTKSWMEAIQAVQSEMKQGRVQKVVLARELRLTAENEFDSALIVQALRIGQPDCYIFSIDYQDTCFLGATPERLVKKEDQLFTSMCLAGSIGRGNTEEEDEQNAAELLQDEKNLVEHRYVVDMIRKVMTSVCTEVNIPHQPGVMRTKNLIHLYTPVEGRGGCNLFEMVEKLHPTPALGGTPREEAMELIREQEDLDRGLYAGPIGWIDYKGNGEFAVGIRSALIRGANASLFAGCGIVESSQPHMEYEETKMKFKPMLSALGGSMK